MTSCPSQPRERASLAQAPRATLILSAEAIGRVLSPDACLEALARAYADLHGDPGAAPQALAFHPAGGSIHVKASLIPRSRDVFAAKINANFPDNPATRSLPTIQGLLVLVDAVDGRPLAVLDSAELTARRTAAATALAARYGARPDSAIATIIGCGQQALHQLEALARVLPLDDVRAVDLDPSKAARLAAATEAKLGIAARADRLSEALEASDVVVTCTTATRPVFTADQVPPGCFVAAVGADNPHKQEIDPALFARARVLVDDADQCAASGDFAHALRAGVVGRDAIAASLAELAAGVRPGRLDPDEVVLFDSTGTGLQDAAAAAAAYRAALERSEGIALSLAA